MRLRRCVPLAALLCAGLTVPASAAVTTGPSGLAFYSPPAPQIVAGPHGSLIWARAIHGGKTPSAGRTWRVLYRSLNTDGKRVAVSGMITLPKGKAPKGGWPVVSWAHGTTGIADSCAPTRMVGGKPDDKYTKSLLAQMNEWLDDGFAVAQTDYQGLGTKGSHPYLIGASEGRSVVDIVSAARGLNRHVNGHWVAIGHSQGGHAVLWAAALGPKYAPGLHLAGAVPLAPANHIAEQAGVLDSVSSNPFGGLPAIIIYAAAVDGGIDPAMAFSDRALAFVPQIEQVCLDKLSADDSFGGIPLNELLRDGYDKAPLLALVSANDPEDLTIKVPLLIAQGKADQTVLPPLTDQTVDELRKAGAKVTYKTYSGVDHNGIPAAARTAADVFIHELLG